VTSPAKVTKRKRPNRGPAQDTPAGARPAPMPVVTVGGIDLKFEIDGDIELA
jgi:hypothetical protein